jgi:hypothetical protein
VSEYQKFQFSQRQRRSPTFKDSGSAMLAADENARRQARRQRFAKEAQRPPPALPTKRIAHAGGKIVTGDKDACLVKLLARKAAAGEELSADQRRALESIPANISPDALATSVKVLTLVPAYTVPAHRLSRPSAPQPSVPVQQTTVLPAPKPIAPVAALGEPVPKRVRTLRKKLHEIEELEARVREGAVLQANQKAKLETKSSLVAELSQLEAAN